MSEEENVEKILSNEKPKSYVAEGATLKCSCGDKECKLKLPNRKSILIQGKLQANIMDFKPNVNIPPFGKCRSLINPTVAAATAANEGRLKKMPCIPNVTMPWIFGKEDTLADGAPALLDCSMNMCVWGGKISIADDGQNVKSARPKDEERIKMGKEKLNNGGMMMLIGLGALLTGIAIVTLPLSIPTLLVGAGVSVAVATATGVTVGAGIAAVGATVMKTGGSEAFEGAQDVAHGNAGSDRSSFNPVRDIDFRGNQGAYDQAKGILTTVAAVGTILLAPVVEMNAPSTAPNPGKTNATEQTAKAGNTAAGKFKLAKGWGKSTTSALRLKSGKIDAVGQTKAAANAGTRPVTGGERYSSVRFRGKTRVNGETIDISRKVYQRNDIDWNRVDPETGLTNLQLAQKGRAPYWNDGTKIELHHLLQKEPSSMVEIPASLHDKYSKILHGLVENGGSFRNNPVLEKQYNNFRSQYWRWRAEHL
jgi:hypothetical protein